VIIKFRHLAFTFIFASLLVFSCKSTPADASNSAGQTAVAEARPLSGGLAEEIRTLIESGRLPSMLQALELIRSRDLSGVDFGRMMSGIASVLIKLVYQDSPVRLPAMDLPQTFSYTRIIREAENGVYVRPQDGSADFFEYILPFLAINDNSSSVTLSEALSDLLKAAELRPNSVLPPFFRGNIHERAGRFAEAEASYRQAYAISDECYPALTGVARIYRLTGRTQEAVTLFSDLITRNPDSLYIKRQLALTFYESRNWARAGQVLDEILQTEPRDGESLLMKAHVLIEQGSFSSAQAPLDTYASINSNNRFYLFLRARVQAEGNRNRDSALNYLRSILRTNPEDKEALIYASGLLMESQRPADQTEGRELLDRLRRISGSSLDVLSLSLRDAVRRENWQEAQGFLNTILASRRTVQDLSDAYLVERGLGNNSRALTFARELYNKDTSNNEYTAIFISALIDNARMDEASRLIESRLSASAGNASAMSGLYFLRSRTRANEEAALGDLRSSLFEDPRNLQALIATFEIYHRRREERRAVYYLKQALAIAPDNPRLKRYEAEYSSLLGR
jgi:tetratricopeptide (TPR) repeat protein